MLILIGMLLDNVSAAKTNAATIFVANAVANTRPSATTYYVLQCSVLA
jgi:hypothetical protein